MEIIHKKYGKFDIFLVYFILEEVQNYSTAWSGHVVLNIIFQVS